MKRHHKERMLIALGCAAGFAVVLFVEKMGGGSQRGRPAVQIAANTQSTSTVMTPGEEAVWTNAPWEWAAQPVNLPKAQRFQVRRVSSGPDWVPPSPGQFDLIDLRHQPSVTVELGR